MTKQIIIQCGSGDCWANKVNDFDATGNVVYVVDDPGETNSNVRAWFPFTVPLRGNTVIEQAYITLTAAATSDTASGNVILGCEDADNPSTPSSGADLNGRTLTSNTVTLSVGGGGPAQWTSGNTLTWQIDNPVTEVLQRTGWIAGNTLAVIIDDGGIGDSTRQAHSYEGDPTKRAYLTINFTDEIPVCGGII
jgi:hypothetical protein